MLTFAKLPNVLVVNEWVEQEEQFAARRDVPRDASCRILYMTLNCANRNPQRCRYLLIRLPLRN